jgi:hypothetical protein
LGYNAVSETQGEVSKASLRLQPQVTKVDNQTFQWYSGYQSLNIAPSQVFSAAEYPIRQAAVAVSISGLEELQNSGEQSPRNRVNSVKLSTH